MGKNKKPCLDIISIKFKAEGNMIGGGDALGLQYIGNLT